LNKVEVGGKFVLLTLLLYLHFEFDAYVATILSSFGCLSCYISVCLGISQIKNLSAMEVNIVRPFIGRALQAFYKHDSPDLIPDPERVSDRRPQAAPNAPRVCLFEYTITKFFLC
jgi:hypothetical protein